MSRSSRRGHRKVAAVALAVSAGLFVSSCADSGNGGGSGDAPDSGSGLSIGPVNEQSGEGDPVKGGTLTFSGYSAVTNLDPAKTQIAGSVAGSELGAIYDTLLRYDPASKEFVPKLAESMEPSSDFKTWTLELRDGVKFSDGTPVDSAAVSASLNRYVTNKGPQSSLYASKVASVDTPDPSTVVFNLVDPWTGIESLLSTGPGMIVAPSAQQGDQFTPIGAGAFTLEKFAPNEELILDAREDYFDGAPNVDKLRLISIVGSQSTTESLKSGGTDVAYMRSLPNVLDLIDSGYPGFVDIPSLSYLSLVNTAPGRPGADVRIRQALALATDPVALDNRLNEGKGLPGQVIFQDTSRWHNDVAPIGVDTAKAKQLLDEAKADGYDGKITYLTLQENSAQAMALALQSMANAVGFDFQIEYVNSVADVVKRLYADRDFDMATGSASLAEADPFERLYSNLKSGGRNNATSFSDPEMDSLLDQLGVATSTDSKIEVLAKIQERANEVVPWQVYGNTPWLGVWGQNVHGIQQSLDGIMFFDKAWKN
ncbi:ABC transporter substrate-binding protein [Rhodococcus erythropolis]|uniref:ABC transporter substrate-binding protein n=1 Tax=Rhodococcus TaxID=1827 RepID=UPI0008062D9B|nr:MULTISPECIES: ABC transporter substrate-binding protein [Rhodococcus]ANQ71297.1 ABC transporter substrate-binding protein [Rhodococcus sp. 008]MCJ0949433.1 ABC transporter substrate-binding protein [Rhodococcus sp. ARC_M8]MYV31313.1 ABC transporter substrate-binding protein [Rhodococcus erythropolis]NDK70789.1 ABC transporter substrate-binding protein [Rhodococcus qingshengii]QEX08719.1 ABC transporter substrate-binding protein [Rhodococcus erythropolis]